MAAVGRKANPPGLALPYGVEGHTLNASQCDVACIRRGVGHATKRGANSVQEGFDGLLRGVGGQRG